MATTQKACQSVHPFCRVHQCVQHTQADHLQPKFYKSWKFGKDRSGSFWDKWFDGNHYSAPDRGAEYCAERVCVCVWVCVCVCLSAIISPELHVRSSPNNCKIHALEIERGIVAAEHQERRLSFQTRDKTDRPRYLCIATVGRILCYA